MSQFTKLLGTDILRKHNERMIQLQKKSNYLNKTSSIDLGCGKAMKNPFLATNVCGVDLQGDISRDVKGADLNIEKIPFPDSSFDYCTAYDFIEHVPRVIYSPDRRLPFVELMNEIYRVLKDDGIFLSVTPAYPTPEAFQDPTHVNFITEDTFKYYFCEDYL